MSGSLSSAYTGGMKGNLFERHTLDQASSPGLRQRAFQNDRGVHTKNKDNTITRPQDASESSQEEPRNILEKISTAQPSIRVCRNKTGVSTAALKPEINREAPFPEL